MVLRSCLVPLLLLAAMMAGYAIWLDQHFERPASLICGGFVGMVSFFCLAAINSARISWQTGRLLAKSEFDTQLVDGQVVAACGTIHPLEEPLTAPFSGKECVLVEYDLLRPKRGRESETAGSDYTGFLMTPAVVRTRSGEVRVLGFPMLDPQDERRCYGYSAAWNARQFLVSHEFEDRAGVKMVSAVAALGVVWADDDGRVEKNMRLGQVTVDDIFPPETVDGLERLAAWEKSQGLDGSEGDEVDVEVEESVQSESVDEEDMDAEEDGPPHIPLPKMTETRVGVGEQVCVTGIYNAELGGLIPRKSSGPINRLLRGTAAELAASERRKAIRHVLGGLLGLAIVHGFIYVAIVAPG
jgi:hypothetical protein